MAPRHLQVRPPPLPHQWPLLASPTTTTTNNCCFHYFCHYHYCDDYSNCFCSKDNYCCCSYDYPLLLPTYTSTARPLCLAGEQAQLPVQPRPTFTNARSRGTIHARLASLALTCKTKQSPVKFPDRSGMFGKQIATAAIVTRQWGNRRFRTVDLGPLAIRK